MAAVVDHGVPDNEDGRAFAVSALLPIMAVVFVVYLVIGLAMPVLAEHAGMGGPVREMRIGDVVRIPPGVKHWYGAMATRAMTHVAIQDSKDGKSVDWLEKVSDAQYRS